MVYSSVKANASATDGEIFVKNLRAELFGLEGKLHFPTARSGLREVPNEFINKHTRRLLAYFENGMKIRKVKRAPKTCKDLDHGRATILGRSKKEQK